MLISTQTRSNPSYFSPGLKTDLKNELNRYHKIDGLKNGSPGDSVQLAPGISNETELKAQIESLSDFLATKGDLEFRPPDQGVERSVHRKQVAESASSWVKASVKPMIDVALEGIMDPSLRALAKAGLEATPAEFFQAPSSSSGRFHPADEINDGGLVLHTCRNVVMAEHLGDFFGVTSKERDLLKTALVLHDTWKGGDPWNGYAQDHGDLAAARIAQLPGGGTEDGKTVQRLVANHMAQWNKLEDKTADPRVPADKLEQIISYADYLGSRDNVYVTVPGATGK